MKYFKPEEFNHYEEMNSELLALLDELRELYGKPIVITSDYRGPDHPIEAAKPGGPGVHSLGVAVDIASVGGTTTLELVRAAIGVGFERIGVSRKNNFIHLDIADKKYMHVKSLWTY